MQEEPPLKEIVADLKRKEYLKNKPKTLYKFRNWNDFHHQKLLCNKEIFFASADQFNDPFDCNPPFVYDQKELTQENIFIQTLKQARKEYPRKNESELHEFVFQQQKNNYLFDDNYIQKFAADNREEINRSFGIFSLSADEKNFLMWSHYADSHTGYCIGFNSYELNKLCDGTLEHVRYQKEIPEIPLLTLESKTIVKFLRTFLFTKSEIWAYEKEYRITINAFARKTLKFPVQCVDEIIFGCQMKHEIKLEILKIIEKQYPDAKVYEMVLHKKEYKLEKLQIR